jgi:HEAT repeat protein
MNARRPLAWILLLVALPFLLPLDAAVAHEGQYRGPIGELKNAFRGVNPRLRPPDVTPPATPPESAPVNPGEGSGSTVRRRVPPVGEDGQGYLRWEFWWEHNKDRYLGLRNSENRESLVVIGGADYLLGGTVRDRVPVVEPLDEELLLEVVVPALRKGTGDPDKDVRAASWIALGKIAVGIEASEFEKGTRDPDADVQKAAFLGLGLFGRPEGIPSLVRALRNEERPLVARAGAAVGLGLMDAPEVTPLLLQILRASLLRKDRNAEEVSAAVIVALGIHRDPAAVAPLLELTTKGRVRSDRLRGLMLTALGRLGDRSATTVLARALRDDSLTIRRAAAIALGEIDLRSEAEEELARLVARREAWKREGTITKEALAEIEARIEAAEALAEAEGKEVRRYRDAIARELSRVVREDSDVQVRNYACISLGKNRGAGAKESLLWAVETGYSISLNAFAALGLGLLGDSTLSPVLLERLGGHGSDNVRGAFGIALGLLRERAAIPTLTAITLYEGIDSNLRGYAAIALGLIGDRDIVPDLQRTLAEEKNDQDLIRGFSLALGLLGDRGSLPVLEEVITARNTKHARGAACMALGFIRDRESVAPLARILENRVAGTRTAESMARGFAAVGLGYSADASLIPRMSRVARNHDYRLFLQGVDDLLRVL